MGAALLLLTQPSIARAHPFLRRSTPAAADSLVASPLQLRLTFSEAIELRFSRLELVAPDGTMAALGPLVVVPDSLGTIVATLPRALGTGEYLVRWQVAGDDAHVVRGEYRFVVGRRVRAGGEAAAVVVPAAEAVAHEGHHLAESVWPAFDASDPLFVGVRWLMYLALVGIVGAAVFQAAVLGRVARRWTALGMPPRGELTVLSAAVGQIAALLLLVTLPLRLVAQSVAMHAPGQAFQAEIVGGMIAHTMWGWSWLAQLALTLAAVVLFRRARATSHWMPVRVVTLFLAFTPAFSGHAIAAERLVPLAVLSDGLHILGAAGWLGTLAVMLIVSITAAVGSTEDHGTLAAELVTAYSPVALTCAALAGLTGVASAWIHIGHLSELLTTAFGRVLLLKLTILSLVVATGAYNWRRVLPALGDRVGAARVVRSASVEALIAILVLFVTAVLVSLPTPLAAGGP
ncbi:MAG: copper resistance protein CopC [Gemmatimonadota bacterium]